WGVGQYLIDAFCDDLFLSLIKLGRIDPDIGSLVGREGQEAAGSADCDTGSAIPEYMFDIIACQGNLLHIPFHDHPRAGIRPASGLMDGDGYSRYAFEATFNVLELLGPG